MHSLQPNFSHIYVEDRAREYALTELFLGRFPNAIQIPIRTYKEVFNRTALNWSMQKQSRKLILAVKQPPFLYQGTQVMTAYGHQNFSYASVALNCVFDCSYCFLQGMYPSAHVVCFVNFDDFANATLQQVRDRGNCYVSVSYDSDLLALESLFGYAARWLAVAEQEPALTIELRTKSSNISPFRTRSALPNVILSWTISPEPVWSAHERGTPGPAARLRALNELARAGWSVRVCLDPILRIPGWQDAYRDLVEKITSTVPAERLVDITVGTLRINGDQLTTIQKWHPTGSPFFSAFESNQGIAEYPASVRNELTEFVAAELRSRLPREKVVVI